MINLGSRTHCNTFWIISGTSKRSTKSGPQDPLFITKTFEKIQEKSPNILKDIILHISTCWKSKKLQNIRHYRTSFSFLFIKSDGPRRIGCSERFQKHGIWRWWNLDKSLKSENLKTQVNPAKSNKCLKNYGICLNHVDFLGSETIGFSERFQKTWHFTLVESW